MSSIRMFFDSQCLSYTLTTNTKKINPKSRNIYILVKILLHLYRLDTYLIMKLILVISVLFISIVVGKTDGGNF